MPELPEVETICRDLQVLIAGSTIDKVFVYDPRVILPVTARKFISNILGKQILKVERRGKAIIISFKDAGFLVVHLKMTGQLIFGKDLKKSQGLKETKVTFQLSNGSYLNYNDQRLFGRLNFVRELKDNTFLKSLGPEPLNGEFTQGWLMSGVLKRNVPIKALLMDQHFLAGIGNIYASEILFDAKIDPRKKAMHVKENEINRLHGSTRKILMKAIEMRGTSMRNYRDSAGEKGSFMSFIKVYGRDGENCRSCQQKILRILQSGRSTFYCSRCQK